MRGASRPAAHAPRRDRTVPRDRTSGPSWGCRTSRRGTAASRRGHRGGAGSSPRGRGRSAWPRSYTRCLGRTRHPAAWVATFVHGRTRRWPMGRARLVRHRRLQPHHGRGHRVAQETIVMFEPFTILAIAGFVAFIAVIARLGGGDDTVISGLFGRPGAIDRALGVQENDLPPFHLG